jgi:hypothetical protein
MKNTMAGRRADLALDTCFLHTPPILTIRVVFRSVCRASALHTRFKGE